MVWEFEPAFVCTGGGRSPRFSNMCGIGPRRICAHGHVERYSRFYTRARRRYSTGTGAGADGTEVAAGQYAKEIECNNLSQAGKPQAIFQFTVFEWGIRRCGERLCPSDPHRQNKTRRRQHQWLSESGQVTCEREPSYSFLLF
jgi:hypothetical protein